MSSVEQDDGCSKVYAGHEVDGELVVARGYSSELLKFVEEPFDEIALFVQVFVIVAPGFAVALGRDRRLDTSRLEGVDEPIRVISLVGDDGLGVDIGQEVVHGMNVVGLA